MDTQEIKYELSLDLQELYKYLKNKYGPVPENYFMDVNCTRKSTKNGRGNEGLFVHHDYEYDPANSLVSDLSKPEFAKQFDYMYQHAENLTYCNYLEHLIIHIKINLLRKEQLNGYINDGVVNYMIPQLNDWYRYIANLKPWQEVAFSLIEDNYSDYVDLVEYWLSELSVDCPEVKSFNWKKLSAMRKNNCII